jgi:hypothetical protein
MSMRQQTTNMPRYTFIIINYHRERCAKQAEAKRLFQKAGDREIVRASNLQTELPTTNRG